MRDSPDPDWPPGVPDILSWVHAGDVLPKSQVVPAHRPDASYAPGTPGSLTSSPDGKQPCPRGDTLEIHPPKLVKIQAHGATKEETHFFCNTIWPQWHLLDGEFSSVQFSSVAQSCPTLCDPMDGESWPLNGTVNYNTSLQLDLFCKPQGKWSDISCTASLPPVGQLGLSHNL